jgi:hypothetical protein
MYKTSASENGANTKAVLLEVMGKEVLVSSSLALWSSYTK